MKTKTQLTKHFITKGLISKSSSLKEDLHFLASGENRVDLGVQIQYL